MFRTDSGTYALMVSIVVRGVILGGAVYSHIVFFPVYLGDLPASSILVNGPYALNEGRFWLMVHPIAIVSMVASLILNWRRATRKKLILFTLACYFLIILITSVYFLPELFAFADSRGSDISPAEWLARGNQWQYLSWIRGTAMFGLMVPLLFALIADDGAAPAPRTD